MDQSFKLLPTNFPSDVRALMYETTTPNTPVDFKDVPAPHTIAQLIQFTNLNEVAHFFRLYELIGGTTLGQLLTDDIVQPQAKSISGKSSLEITVGSDITANSDTYDGSTAHADLVGLIAGQHYEIEERGVGTLKAIEFQDIGQPGFGFKLLQNRTFQDQDTFFLHFLAKLVSIPGSGNTSVVGNKLFSDIVEINADTTLDSTYIGKLIDTNATGTTLVITLDFLNSFTDNSVIGFKQHRGNQINTVIQTQSAEVIYFRGQQVSEVIIAKGEHVYFTKKNGKWHVFDSFGQWGEVGQPNFGYSQLDNTVIANGSLLLRAEYPRLWNYVNSIGALITDSQWNQALFPFGLPIKLYEGNFSSGNGTTTFRLPNLQNMFFRGTTTGRPVASKQLDQVGEHDHPLPIRADSQAEAFAVKSITPRSFEDFVTNYPNTDVIHLTDKNTVDPNNKENIVKNIGFLPLIKI